MVNNHYRVIKFEVKDIFKKRNYSQNCSEWIHHLGLMAKTHGLEYSIPK